MNIAPNADARYVMDFCSSVIHGSQAKVVQCRSVSDGAQNDCFPLVEEHVKVNGVQSAFGWAIWELPGVFIEAEFHAVWQASDRSLVDIAPRSRPFTEIVFYSCSSAGSKYLTRKTERVNTRFYFLKLR